MVSVWDDGGSISSQLKDMVWDLNGTSHRTVYSWDIPMGCPIGMLFLEYDCCSGVTFGSHDD